ncbi:O-succinylbenzoic acid--CoA ligase [Microbacterium esteraromaticum]|uniref:O-succinylbenzoic acid--CoA ligase n=1 Tax=Microbacterium esteraromaticum TaxID=57043 RepID=A0A1R4KDL7_9MICO|nr:AMP-binding protein [Microbacterium esteraromaticum]SJN42254.1 O-succinylbenzoic acid--CoA ligase [Microbacterium esteraromaticum]
MRLHPIDADDPRAVRAALPAALDGIRPLALGFIPGPDDVVPDGTAAVVATSGSSGVPKRVILSADALQASASATASRIGDGQWMLALPAGYVAGLQVLVRSLLAGTDPTFVDGRLTPEAFVEATPQAAGDDLYVSLVPAQLATLIDAADADPAVVAALRAHRAILVGGQALSDSIRMRAMDLRVPLVHTYGSSETSGGCVYNGVPLDGVRVAQVDDELRISGPMLASGYLGDPALTDRIFMTDDQGERWYRTGDRGFILDGEVEVHGRLDNVIVSGGINISLDRVERIVRTVPGLEQAVVLGMPDERWGESSIIFATPASGDGRRMLDDARARVAAEIGKHARPVQLELGDDMPMLASGKPDRELLRRMIHDVPPPPDGDSGDTTPRSRPIIID